MRKAQGFTLMELVVAVAIMLIIGAAVTPMLLSHIKDAKVASVNETLLNTKTAFDSYFASEEGSISDTTILDNVIAAGFLGQTPSIDNIGDITIELDDTTVSGYDIYTIEADLGSVTYADVSSVLEALDVQLDGEADGLDGSLLYSDGGTLSYQIAKILQ
jgi:prepilin-type N-terminal cleavage/methylation domain-containing protein